MARALTRRRFLAQSVATTVSVGLVGCQKATRRRVEDVRGVRLVVPSSRSRDGAGVKLRRALGHRGVPMLDPFLLLDEIDSRQPADYRRGFPTHPHRGFETVSYLIAGSFEHRDSVGNQGVIGAGDVQWMTAGRGIVHSEMPRAGQDGHVWGLQLWVNLPAARKMTAPRYQELGAAEIPEIDVEDARVRLVAGRVAGRTGPIDGIAVAPTLLDATLPAGGSFRHGVPEHDSTFAYVLSGTVHFGPQATLARDGHLVIFEAGREVVASSAAGGRFLLLSAAPIGEPVARRGPFVMNTDAEIRQAIEDYRSGRLVSDV